MQKRIGPLTIYEAGKSSVVGFRGQEVVDDAHFEQYREGLVHLIENERCETLVLDLTGVKLISSSTLGFLFSLHNQGVRIRLYNASESVREVLEITNLDEIFLRVDTLHTGDRSA